VYVPVSLSYGHIVPSPVVHPAAALPRNVMLSDMAVAEYASRLVVAVSNAVLPPSSYAIPELL
jgi:hypothetical protein